LPLRPAEGALAHQIDEAADLLALADRDLAQHQRAVGETLQRLQRRADTAARQVHLVDEDDVRNGAIVEEPQQRRQGKHLLRLRLADDNGQVDHHQRVVGVLSQLDEAGTVKEGPGLAQVLRRRDVDLRRHLSSARFRRAVAHGVAVAHAPSAADRPGERQHALEKRCLTREVGTDEGGAARR
jgi:hypothetical protein